MDARQELIAYIDHWYAVFPEGNADQLAALYTPDARLMLADLPAQKGSAAIGGLLAAMAGYAEMSITHAVTDIEVLGEGLALITGSSLAVSKIRKSGEERKDASRFFMVMQKGEDGQWLCHYDLSQPTPDVAFPD